MPKGKRSQKSDSIELAKFRLEVPALIKKKIIAKMHKRIFSFENWTIQTPQYERDNWKVVFKEMEEAFCKYFRVNESQTPNLLNDIVFPKFSRLQWLELKQNGIENIEAITFMDAPLLRILNLQENFIINLKPIQKINFPHLQTIRFESNHLQTFSNAHRRHRMKCNKQWFEVDMVSFSSKDYYNVEAFMIFAKMAVKTLFIKKYGLFGAGQTKFVCMYNFQQIKQDLNPFKPEQAPN